jgi:hypothetical protein
MLDFCLRSLVREYGWRFASRVALRRPMRTLRAFRDAARLDVTGGGLEVASRAAGSLAAGPPSIVGVGFCLKPVDPPCPSGRANHGCLFLETLAPHDAAGVPAPCRSCAIRDIGMRSLRAGSAFYVMTSARDILEDVYVPAIERGRFPTGLFVLCRYSFKPFAAGLLASGMSARLLPLDQGDCRDYRTWLLADRGVKLERTMVAASGMTQAASVLGTLGPARAVRFERRGHVLYPATAGPAA